MGNACAGYQLRSPSDQGGGIDLSNVDEMAHHIAKKGASIIGIPPIHAMFSQKPEDASPYSPSSREFFNYMICDVTAIEEFKQSTKIQAIYDDPAIEEKRRKLQRHMWVDYADVADIKNKILNACYEDFEAKSFVNPDSVRAKNYRDFCSQWDESNPKGLHNYATFEALSEYFASKEWTDKGNPKLLCMKDWPEEYQDFSSPEVAMFKQNFADRIGFYKYAQFEACNQLGLLRGRTTKDFGMDIGTYTDLAVGSSKVGFEAWASGDDYMKASAGAAPDDLCASGQNWGLMGFKPHKLVESSYSQFIGMMRANMKYAGCTRLDHVLQLNRLYMIPDGKSEKEGVFVYYKADDLMSLVALESHRNKTMFIGEDIGDTPDGFREKLADYGINRYCVLPFEREKGYREGDLSPENNKIKDMKDLPKCAAVALSTHDTPPAESQNTLDHIKQREAWGCYENDAQKQMEVNQYRTYRQALNIALEENKCWEKVGGKPSTDPLNQPFDLMENKHIQAQVAYLGMSDANIVLIPPSDVTGIKEQHNCPGTAQTQSPKRMDEIESKADYRKDYEWVKAGPNWRKKEAFEVQEIGFNPLFNEVADILNSCGRGHDRQLQGEYKRPGRNEDTVSPERRYELWQSVMRSQYFKDKKDIAWNAKYSEKHTESLKKLNEGMKESSENKYKKIEEWKKKKALENKISSKIKSR